MFKYLNPKRFYYAVGKKKFLEFILLAVFMLFFYGPLMYMCITAFGNVYEVPNIFPTEWGFKWWNFVFSQKSLVSSIVQSLTIAVITTVGSMVLCIPAAYSLARFRFPGRKVFMLSFLLTNAFPKLGIYTSIGILFYKYNLMGTLLVGLARIKTMPVEMYGIILDYPGQAGAVFAILLMIPAAVMILAMKKYIGPEAIAGGFKMK